MAHRLVATGAGAVLLAHRLAATGAAPASDGVALGRFTWEQRRFFARTPRAHDRSRARRSPPHVKDVEATCEHNQVDSRSAEHLRVSCELGQPAMIRSR